MWLGFLKARESVKSIEKSLGIYHFLIIAAVDNDRGSKYWDKRTEIYQQSPSPLTTSLLSGSGYDYSQYLSAEQAGMTGITDSSYTS